MTLSTAGLPLLVLLAIMIWFWQNTLAAREQALRAAREICLHQQLQLLDGTVVLQRTRLRRSSRGPATLQRTFQFAYSMDGIERNTGFVIVLGNHIEQAGL